MLSRSNSAPTTPVSSPVFIRTRARTSPCLEYTLKPYRKYKRDPDNWHRLFLSFDSRSVLTESMAHWLERNALGVRYKTFYHRYKQWKQADEPSPPPSIEVTSLSLSSPPCHIPGIGDARGGHNRKWSREMEQQC